MKNHMIKAAVIMLTAVFLVFGPDAMAEVFVPETVGSAVDTAEGNGSWGDCRSSVLADGVCHLEPAPVLGANVAAVEAPSGESPTVQVDDEPAKTTAEAVAEDSPITYRGFSEGDVVHARISHYDGCATCNGAKYVGMDAMGGRLREGTIACNWLPLGSQVSIDGRVYTVRDRMARTERNGIPCIDVYVNASHSRAYDLGVLYNAIEITRLGW